MTALREYALLECVGWYAETPDAPAQEVVVSFGDATLTIQQFDETPLAHWPLATLVRAPGPHALTLAPDLAAPERLGLDDAAMIAALTRIDTARAPARPPRFRARTIWRLTAAAAVVALAGLGWRHAPDIAAAIALQTSASARAAIGDTSASAFAGPALCRGPEAAAVLRRIRLALPPGAVAPTRLWVVDRPTAALALAAPGGRILLSAPALRDGADAAAASEALARAMAASAAQRPIIDAVREAGFTALRATLSGVSLIDVLGAASARTLASAPPYSPPAPLQSDPPMLSPSDLRALVAACD